MAAHTYEVILVCVYDPARRMTKLVRAHEVNRAVRRAKTLVPDGFTEWQLERASRVSSAERLVAA